MIRPIPPAAPRSIGLRPAGQGSLNGGLPPLIGDDLSANPPSGCPAPPYCPSLPSSETANEVLTNPSLGTVAKVGRDLVLRGALIWIGIASYDAATGREDPKRLQRAIAGAAGIELFVLGWLWLKKPRSG